MALILNPATGHISPQFHVVFDDGFSTIEALQKGYKPENWEFLYDTSKEVAGDDDMQLADEWQKLEAIPIQPLAW